MHSISQLMLLLLRLSTNLHIVFGDGYVPGVRVIDQLSQSGRIHIMQCDVYAIPFQHIVCIWKVGQSAEMMRTQTWW